METDVPTSMSVLKCLGRVNKLASSANPLSLSPSSPLGLLHAGMADLERRPQRAPHLHVPGDLDVSLTHVPQMGPSYLYDLDQGQ